MEYRNEEVHGGQGSSQQESHSNGERKEQGRNDGGAAQSGIPKSETEGSDADKDRGGEPSIGEETQDDELEAKNQSGLKRNHWNSITFDYDDFFGGLTPA